MKLNKNFIRQFCSYFLVGGVAALVEWASFGICSLLSLHYLLSTVIAFLIATYVNWIMGRKLTFKENVKNIPIWKDILGVYLASLFGLFLNMGLMFVFVSLINLPEMLSKIGATGFVFIWNFLIRKFFIYKT